MDTTTHTIPTDTPVTIAYHYDGMVTVHADGCKASSRDRRGRGFRAETRQITIGTVIEIVTNPDEGELAPHACVRATLRTALRERGLRPSVNHRI